MRERGNRITRMGMEKGHKGAGVPAEAASGDDPTRETLRWTGEENRLVSW